VNPEALRKLITPRTKALIVNTPTNPTGVCFSQETLLGIAQIAKEHDLIVIADDIYRLYSFDRPFVPIMSLEGMRERTITINSFSKDYTMTGWRIGNIIAPAYLIGVVQQINENVVFTAPSISQRGALYALRNREAIQPRYYEEYKKRLFYAAGRINGMKNISVLPPKGTFYLFANIKKTGLPSAEVSERILQEAHVNTLPGDAFGDAGEGYIRFACTCGIEKLKEAFDRIAGMALFQ
jgi:aspartate/methionine/tyrosine aminotransferase